MPAWYGLGTALKKIHGESGIEVLRKMYNDWPFFHMMIDNIGQAIAKADLAIAKDYALRKRSEASCKYNKKIEEEYILTENLMLEIIESDRLLEDNKNLHCRYIEENLIWTH